VERSGAASTQQAVWEWRSGDWRPKPGIHYDVACDGCGATNQQMYVNDGYTLCQPGGCPTPTRGAA
jgi:hypothetical protein